VKRYTWFGYTHTQGRLLGDANDAFASGPPAQKAPRGPPDQPTGQNYAFCGKKMVKILPPAVKNGENMAPGVEYDQNFISRGEKRSKFCLRR
jgi:hypothetical protein